MLPFRESALPPQARVKRLPRNVEQQKTWEFEESIEEGQNSRRSLKERFLHNFGHFCHFSANLVIGVDNFNKLDIQL